ncbi:MAG: hypothetical protein AVDCRST_MAG88-1667 [uncultured Thermomicrobiales bacterium]|uniref:Uncharacterized protein n=1 Tax=uncultured Thermomicrobiales bacterium TaxID=1645740 RepID=A0A6J4UY81_9BACT|nr:MAG: hypothetical protein AVDCRST_MAG88-1667 [uncultured Thermomicrobiales bacterium]
MGLTMTARLVLPHHTGGLSVPQWREEPGASVTPVPPGR